jgi:hypothetical protein
MAIRLDETWDTANNRDAEGSTFLHSRKRDISDSFLEPPAQMPDPNAADADEDAGPPPIGGDDFPLTEDQLMRLVRSAYSQGTNYQQTVLQPRWLAAYNAYNNKHNSDSKYLTSRYRGRTRLFRPKTRSTARKKQAEAAAALFSTSDALIVRATDESDKKQLAAAELQGALLKFRLDRGSETAAIPWFMISMGAHLSAQQTGICISKQYWEYRRDQIGTEEVPITVPVPPHMIPLVGAPVVAVGSETKPVYRVVRDRPRIMLFPPEDVIRDPAAAWENQAQDSSYLILKHPMSVEAARTFLDQVNDKSAMRFHDLTDDQIAASAGGAGTDQGQAAAVRRAREHSSNDRYSDQTVDNAYKTVWLHENFFRIGGTDYCFWTLGERMLISDVIPTEEAYPEHAGARPVTIGVGALDPFKIDPMAPIESWQPLQQEINDVVNLRLDTMKQSIAPLAKVRRGAGVDVRAIQNRTPDSVVYMQQMTDVEFDRPGDVGASAYAEMERLNADFDDQAGNFSAGSVQTNRSLNETVGGMKLMAGSANALGEFDLRVWMETWVEPVLRQIVKLIQYYESDQNVIAISAKRAKLMPRFGIDQVTDDMLTSQITLTVDVGIGSSDPMLSLQKFEKAAQVAVGLLGAKVQMEIKRDAVIDELFGKAGYQDAAERFFNKSVEEDPRLKEAEAVIQQMQAALQEAEKKLADKQGDQQTRIKVAQIGAVGRLASQEMSQQHQAQQALTGAAIDSERAAEDREFQREQGAMQQPQQGASPAKGDGAAILDLLGMEAPTPMDPQQIVDPVTNAMMQGFRMMADQMMQQQQALSRQIAQSNAQVISAVTAPKRIIRDENGMAAGVEVAR